MKKIKLKEIQLKFLQNSLNEDVYTKNIDRNNKKANISYKKGFNANSFLTNTLTPSESIRTDKMDSSNSDTYIVPLKNGINSYNITSIEGKEIMHYFKRHFSDEATTVAIKVNGKKENYELNMENNEINQFLKQFVDKINFIIYDYVSKHRELTNRKIYRMSQVCIYPVKSSSNFNSKVADLLLRYNKNLFGLPVVKLNEKLLRKDASNIQKDEDFISKNLAYYNSRRGRYNTVGDAVFDPGVRTQTHMNGLNSDLNMFKARNELNKEIGNLNNMVKTLLTDLYAYRTALNKGNEKLVQYYGVKIASEFPQYCLSGQDKEIIKFASYVDDMGNKIAKRNENPTASAADKASGKNLLYYRAKKSTKTPSVDKNTSEIIQITKQYNPEAYNSLSRNKFVYQGKYVSVLDTIKVMYREPIDYQIKKIFNDSRMGLKNVFSFDEKELELAKEQIAGNVLVIFDDNISGGATLSDICAQFLSIGVKHIIPITFGKMFQQWGGAINKGFAKIYEPENGFVFGDNKTFVFNGRTFNTDQITNPMDAANIYRQTFGTYDKQGATELWNTWNNVKKNINKL